MNQESIGVLGGMKPYPMTKFDRMLNLEYNPVYRQEGQPKDHTYEAFSPPQYDPRTKFDRAMNKVFCSSCKGGYWNGARVNDNQYSMMTENYQPSAQGYANIMDDPYNSYSYYADYLPIASCPRGNK